MVNNLPRSPTTSQIFYFANNKQVFTAVFCFTHAEYHLIKLKLYNNWSVQAVNYAMWISRKPIKFAHI